MGRECGAKADRGRDGDTSAAKRSGNCGSLVARSGWWKRATLNPPSQDHGVASAQRPTRMFSRAEVEFRRSLNVARWKLNIERFLLAR